MARPWGRKDKVEMLARIPLFSACSQRELGLVAGLTGTEHLVAGTVLTLEGRAGGIAYVLLSGKAEVIHKDRRVASLGYGDVVGELSLIDGKPRSATVRAITDVDVLEIDGRSLGKLMDKAPSVQRKMLKALAERLRDADAKASASI